MKKIIEVLDCFKLQNFGVIVSGVNPEFDRLNDREIKEVIGKEILLVSPDNHETKLKVHGVDIGTSLIGKKNISICFGKHINKEDIIQYSAVFSYE